MFNNPLRYTDPTGMMSLSFRQIFAVVFAAVYAYFTWDLTGAAAVYAAMIGGAVTGAIATGTWKGAITGAFTGALTAGVGWAANANDWANLTRIGAQAVSGGIVESLSGGNFGNGFFAAGLTAAFMPQAGHRNPAVRAVKGALIGGTISEATGGKFANGAVSGAIQAAMAGGKRSQIADDSNVLESRNPDAANRAIKLANDATVAAKIYKPYQSERAAAEAWWGVIEELNLPVEVGVIISRNGDNFFLGNTYSNGAVHNVNGLLSSGHVARGTVPVAFAHTHPGNSNLSGGGMAYSAGNYGADGRVDFGWDIHGDMRTGYENRMSAYSFSPSGSDFWSYSQYRAMQNSSPGTKITLCAAARSGC